MPTDDKRKACKPEIIPPDEPDDSPTGARPAIYAEIIAQFNKYTDRPDLFLETIEKADPGFIKRLNEEAERFSRRHRDARFRFGRHQAYVALGVGALAAVGLIGAVYYLIATRQAGFGALVGIALLYAVTQGGASGFASLISSLKDGIERFMKSKPDDGN